MQYTIDKVLKNLKLTPTELAAKLGVSYRAVKHWQDETRKPSKPVVILINQLMKGK